DWSGGVFLFQAEGGIRDATVTGVQTCALPISPGGSGSSSSTSPPPRPGRRRGPPVAPAAAATGRAPRTETALTPTARVLVVSEEIGRAACRERWGGGVVDGVCDRGRGAQSSGS